MNAFFRKIHRLRFWSQADLPIAILILAFLVLGLRLVTSYGESWDEPYRIDYARASLMAYTGGDTHLPDEKGPFYGMVAYLGAKALARLVPGWLTIDGWHFMTYLSFLMGLYFFYRLCRRLVDSPAALAATLLFGTQPVIWGHAFINPKDIPFMSFFLASVFLGLNMVDHFPLLEARPFPPRAAEGGLAHDWQTAPRRLKRWLAGLGLAWIGLTLVFPWVQTEIASLVEWVYAAPQSSLIGQIFLELASASNQSLVYSYIHKAQKLSTILALAAWFGLAVAFWILASRVFPTIRRGILSPESRSGNPIAAWWGSLRLRIAAPACGSQAGGANTARLGQWLKTIGQPRVLAAACFLGFCSDIRTLGPASGLLVAVYFLFKVGRKAIPTLLAYLAVGALVTYVFWPYLWKAPVTHYLDSLSLAANYDLSETSSPGDDVAAASAPSPTYLPNLFSLQFTETALGLILIGIVIAAVYLVQKKPVGLDVLLLATWFAAPVGFAILNHSTLYDNFRQFLFVLPPLFVLASLALQVFWSFLKGIRRQAVFGLAALALLVPAIYWNVHLYPYEYVYYNSLAGNLQQAARIYETDYWATSIKADLEYLNETAPLNTTILLPSANLISIAENYARPDLSFGVDVAPAQIQPDQESVYTIVLPFIEDDPGSIIYPDAPTVFQVSQDGAILSEVQEIR